MKCLAAAQYSSLSDRRTCGAGAPIGCDVVTTENALLCTCGFQSPTAPRAQQLHTGPVIAPNFGPFCPAYHYDQTTFFDGLNDTAYSIQTNEAARKYQKVTVTLGVGEQGAFVASAGKVTMDYNNFGRVSYHNYAYCQNVNSNLLDNIVTSILSIAGLLQHPWGGSLCKCRVHCTAGY